jgi:ketosteroid isomerase-like protein
MLKLERTPVMGKEERELLSAPMIALSEFYEALNTRDMQKMGRNWAQTEDAVMNNPLGGIKRGWREIRTVYEKIFNSPGHYWFDFYDYSFHEAGEFFYIVDRKRGEYRVVETVLNMVIRTTRVFRLIGGRWRQVHHHGSIDGSELLAAYQQAVKSNV